MVSAQSYMVGVAQDTVMGVVGKGGQWVPGPTPSLCPQLHAG
jgi:hypothetical protein